MCPQHQLPKAVTRRNRCFVFSHHRLDLFLLEFPIIGIIPYVLFSVLILSPHNSFEIHPRCWVCWCFIPSHCWVVLHCMYTPVCLSIHLLMDIWSVASFRLLKRKLLCTFVYKSLYEHMLSFHKVPRSIMGRWYGIYNI